ncbi:hypothetical protein ABH931_006138 [Streptacidiphilus sp. MAP12-33]|uniref:hypothetical protein n=1 Tax=Streptacidiphilus sp. MAP12-33 TaxID=3156266 RepID=UPI003517506A
MSKMRDGGGRYAKDPSLPERDAEFLRLRKRGLAYRAIAAETGYDVKTVHEAVKNAMAAITEEPAQEVRQLELERLDDMWMAVMQVLEAKHFKVSDGRLVRLGDEPLEDDAPVLAAVDRLLRIQERRSKLLGLDSAQRVDMSGGVTYEIVGVDPSLLS